MKAELLGGPRCGETVQVQDGKDEFLVPLRSFGWVSVYRRCKRPPWIKSHPSKVYFWHIGEENRESTPNQ